MKKQRSPFPQNKNKLAGSRNQLRASNLMTHTPQKADMAHIKQYVLKNVKSKKLKQ
jgi:hypothetical protein